MKIAFLYSSKNGIASSVQARRCEEVRGGEDPPPDFLAECDSDETLAAIGEALGERHDVFPIEADEEAYLRLKKLRPDLVFNIAEGLVGPNRESHIPSICEMLGIPYTGSDPLTLGICLDKSRAKEILAYHRIPTPAFWVVENEAGISLRVKLPAIVKPLHEGSSKGIKDNSVVRDRRELKARVREIQSLYRQPVIIEPFLTGREFTVGALGNPPNIEVLPIVEIDLSELPPGANPVYSYEAKWIWDQPDKPLEIFRCPARLDVDLKNRIESVVRKTIAILRIRDWCRIDLRLDERGEPNVLEINPLPGVLPNPEENSCLPKAARTAGYSYSALIHRVVDEAAARYGIKNYGKRKRFGRDRLQSFQSCPSHLERRAF
ncbi:MAG: ATP-grasp domain-containing protein [Candidatus Aminicenantes bacterium]|nr:ATP-grasp domain-containing protein [Candidatus Aminicenantes bacterium]